MGHARIHGVFILASARSERREVLDEHARAFRAGGFQREGGLKLEHTAGVGHALGRAGKAQVRVQAEALAPLPVHEQAAAQIESVAGNGAASRGKAQHREKRGRRPQAVLVEEAQLGAEFEIASAGVVRRSGPVLVDEALRCQSRLRDRVDPDTQKKLRHARRIGVRVVSPGLTLELEAPLELEIASGHDARGLGLARVIGCEWLGLPDSAQEARDQHEHAVAEGCRSLEMHRGPRAQGVKSLVAMVPCRQRRPCGRDGRV